VTATVITRVLLTILLWTHCECRSCRSTSVGEVRETILPGYRIDLLLRRVYRPSVSTTWAQYSRSITSARASVYGGTRRRLLVRRWNFLISLVVESTARTIAGSSSAAHLSASSRKLGSRSATWKKSVLLQSLRHPYIVFK